MRHGFHMEVPAGSAQSWLAAFTGRYDDEEIELLLQYIKLGSLTLDIGASLGFYTVPFALTSRSRSSRVVAIEPIATNCAVLLRNLERNGVLETVSVIQVAVGARRAEVLLHVETGGAGNATIVTDLSADEVARHDRAGLTGSSEVAQVYQLDNLELPPADRNRPCGLIKIDAEGYDMDVLAGGGVFIRRHQPVIFGEFSPSWLTTRGIDPSAPLSWAAANGYDCSELVYARRHALSERRSVHLRPLGMADVRSGTSILMVPKDGGGSAIPVG